MNKYKLYNGKYIEMTAEEITAMQEAQEQAEREYWQTVDYAEAVNAEIRKRYTESAEFAILRQKDEKPEEYAEHYAYCEDCKQTVKEKIEEYSAGA